MILQYINGDNGWTIWTKSEPWPSPEPPTWRVLNSDHVPMMTGTYDECEAYHDRMVRTIYRG